MRITSTLIGLFLITSCSVKPGGGKKHAEDEKREPIDLEEIVDQGHITLEMVTMRRPFQTQEFQSKQFRIDGQALKDSKIFLTAADGMAWDAAWSRIDDVNPQDLGVSFSDHIQAWLSASNFLWRTDLNEIMRSKKTLPSGVLSNSTKVDSFAVKATAEELDSEGRLRILGVSDHLLVSVADRELVVYLATEERLYRQVLPLPAGVEEWNSSELKSFGFCQKDCVWFAGKERLWVFKPLAEEDFTSGEWTPYKFTLNYPGDWSDIQSMAFLLDTSGNQPSLNHPGFMIAGNSFYVTKEGYNQIFTNRTFNEQTVYEWPQVLDVAKDYCLSCHGGPMGLGAEAEWLGKKNDILNYIVPESKETNFTMPPKDSNEAKDMTDDERRIIAAWLISEGAEKAEE